MLDKTEILLKVALNVINQTNQSISIGLTKYDLAIWHTARGNSQYS